MKKQVALPALFLLLTISIIAQVGVGTTTPDASSVLEIKSSNKGLLIPRVILTGTNDATTIVNPANSLMVYNSIGSVLPIGHYYNKNTAANPVWVKVKTSSIIWKTNVAGNYNIRAIVDVARSNGILNYGVYKCILKTNNAARWSGRSFMLNANFYIGNAFYHHQVYNVIDISAITSGCSTGGLTAFNATTGAFSFAPGVCFQSITLTCSCQ